MTKTRCVPLLALLLLEIHVPSAAQDEAVERQQASQFEGQIPVKLNYLLYLPKDYESQEKWPLLLFLHGAGERGDDLNRVKVHGPPKLIEAGKDFPMIVVSPQCPPDQWWKPHELLALLDDIARQHRVDQDRIYVTGLSMGGFGTWALASQAPERFAAIAPICGGGDKFRARRIRELPLWAFHGDADRAVPVELTRELVEAVRSAGGDPKLTIYEGVEHDSWTATYENEELYEWMLSHRRGE